MGFSFTVENPRLDDEERFFKNVSFADAVRELSLAKARYVSQQNPHALVIAGDTVVCVDTQVLGKPRSRDEGRQMLTLLSGRSHQVYSGVALLCGTCRFAEAIEECTSVFFRTLSPEEIDTYLDTGEYADKAGAYAIQGNAMTFVDKIDGCFYNVVGLPISKTIALFSLYRNRKGPGND